MDGQSYEDSKIRSYKDSVDRALDIVSCMPCQLFITAITVGCVLERQTCGSVLGRLNIDCHQHAKKKSQFDFEDSD